MDAQAASRFPEEDPCPLDTEYNSAAGLLTRLMGAAPNRKYVLLRGNHDDNILRKNRLRPEIRALADPRRHPSLGPVIEKWVCVPYVHGPEGVWWCGSVAFVHGFTNGALSDRNEAVLTAGDRSGVLVVRGHTHRPQPVTQVMLTRSIPLPIWYANTGTLGPLKPDWTNRMNTRGWAPAVVLIETNKRCWYAETIRLD